MQVRRYLVHYNDVIMRAIASQITSLTIVYSTVSSGADERKHQSSASLAFVRGIPRSPVNSPHRGSVMRKMFPFDDVIMLNHKIKANIKAPRHWPLWEESINGFPSQRASNADNIIYFMTSSLPVAAALQWFTSTCHATYFTAKCFVIHFSFIINIARCYWYRRWITKYKWIIFYQKLQMTIHFSVFY